MKNGYQQFFKQAKQVASNGGARTSVKNTSQSLGTKKTSVFNDEVTMNGNSKPQFRLKKESQEMTNDLRARMRKKSKKPLRKIPWKIVGVSMVGVLIAFAGLNNANEVDQFLKRIEFSLMGKALAEEKPAAKEGAAKEKDSHAKIDEKNKDGKAQDGKAQDSKSVEAAGVKKEFSDDEINHFGKLNERKRDLDAREEELNRMEAELSTQKIELEKRMTELDSTRRQISSVLEEKVKIDEKKVDALVQMYTSMKPQQSAKIFETMDEDLAIEILGRMKRKSAAEILNLLKAEKAQTLSEKYSGFKKH